MPIPDLGPNTTAEVEKAIRSLKNNKEPGMELSVEFQKPIVINFIDFNKTADSIHKELL